MKPDLEIIPVGGGPTENLGPEGEEKLEIGQWYWVKSSRSSDEDEVGTSKWLGCITYLGSNYAEMTSVSEGSSRVAFSRFDDICTRELRPDLYIKGKIAHHQEEVGKLMDKIRQVTAALGVVPRDELADRSTTQSTALAVAHGAANVEAHKKALIKAKEKTLPELFEKIRKQHEKLAVWMKAELIEAKAALKKMEKTTKVIEDRIFTVQLYAGLVEQLKKIRDGKPADNDAKVRLFQRQHFMDEECLHDYEGGGMEFKDVGTFDKWLLRPENLNRILPFDRCIVSFRVRRETKQRDFESFREMILFAFSKIEEYEKKTFLYIRNGQQVFRLITEIDFGEQLFPDREQSTLLGNQSGDLWIRKFADRIEEVLSQREYDGVCAERVEEQKIYEAAMAKYRVQLAAWEALSKEQQQAQQWADGGRGRGKPSEPFHLDPDRHSSSFDRYEKLTQEHVYYDDAMRKISKEVAKHNRVAVVLQGLLDRSPALQPHPPWKIWTAEGFKAGIEPIYDDSKGLSTGMEAPDFETYRVHLNKSVKVGDIVVGQQDAWLRAEAKKENERRRNDWRISPRDRHDLKRFKPHGNPGPGLFARVARITRKGEFEFEWYREFQKVNSVNEAYRPILTKAVFPSSLVLSVTGYTRGDYKLFYSDPRTRAQYLKWAQYLLHAEDYAQGAVKPVPPLDTTPTKTKSRWTPGDVESVEELATDEDEADDTNEDEDD